MTLPVVPAPSSCTPPSKNDTPLLPMMLLTTEFLAEPSLIQMPGPAEPMLVPAPVTPTRFDFTVFDPPPSSNTPAPGLKPTTLPTRELPEAPSCTAMPYAPLARLVDPSVPTPIRLFRTTLPVVP